MKSLKKGSLIRLVYSDKRNDFSIVRVHEVEELRISIVSNCGYKEWFSTETGKSLSKSSKYLLPKER